MAIQQAVNFLEVENHGGPGISERKVRHSVIVNFVERSGAIRGAGIDGVQQTLEGHLRILRVLDWLFFKQIIIFQEDVWSGTVTKMGLQTDMSGGEKVVSESRHDRDRAKLKTAIAAGVVASDEGFKDGFV